MWPFPLLTLINQSVSPSLPYLHLANPKCMTWIPFSWYCCVSRDFLQWCLWHYREDNSRKKLIIYFGTKSYIQLGVSWIKYHEEAKWKPPSMEGPWYLLIAMAGKTKGKAPLEISMLIFINWCSKWYQKSCKL